MRWHCNVSDNALLLYCCADVQPLSSSRSVADKASGLQKDIDSASLTTSHLTTSFYALLAWVVLITVALLTIVALSYRWWRRQRRRAAEWDATSSDASSVCSRPPNDGAGAAATGTCRDRTLLEGVEIGRRASSSHASLGDALDSCAASTGEPWRTCTDVRLGEPVMIARGPCLLLAFRHAVC